MKEILVIGRQKTVGGNIAVRVLLVEDTKGLADAVAKALRGSGYAVDHVETGEDAEAALGAFPYDAVILDLNLPGIDGLQVLGHIRERGEEIPVLVLTARGSLDERINGLDLGADDYLTKPFEISELEARLRAIIRRGFGRKESVLRAGRIAFDTVHRSARLDDRDMNLPKRELLLLEALLYRIGRVISKDQLAESMTEFDDELSPSAVELYISRLRKRLSPAGIKIRAIRGLGYVLEEL